MTVNFIILLQIVILYYLEQYPRTKHLHTYTHVSLYIINYYFGALSVCSLILEM